MPTYEMPLLLRLMTKPEITATLKRTAELIFEKGGFIRKIENLGKKQTPFKMVAHGNLHKEANYFVFYFDVPPMSVISLQDEYNRDIDIIRNSIVKQEERVNKACLLHEEILPPAYRPDVKKLMEIAKAQEKRKNKKNKFEYNSGLSYYPFQR